MDNQIRTLSQILEQQKQLREQLAESIEQEKITRANMALPCASCEANNIIKETELFQSHHYVPPHSCTEGDYWLAGECQFLCSHCCVINRLLFRPYFLNKLLAGTAEHKRVCNEKLQKDCVGWQSQFFHVYQPLFKNITKTYKNKVTNQFHSVNNYYISDNFQEFLIEV